MKVSALIVDDEQPARDELAYLLKGLHDVEVVGQGKNGVEALNLIRELNPQIVFLDVQMPGLDGFGVIKKLLDRKARLPFFIFATAYDHYAVQAFEVNAIDYLLKPIAKQRLEKAIGKVRRELESAEPAAQKLDRLVQLVEERPSLQRSQLHPWAQAPPTAPRTASTQHSEEVSGGLQCSAPYGRHRLAESHRTLRRSSACLSECQTPIATPLSAGIAQW